MNIYNSEYDDEEVTEITFEQMEELRESCKPIIALGLVASKLYDSSEFQEVIIEEYLSKEPKRLGTMIASGLLPPLQVEESIKELKAMGTLTVFLKGLVEKGNIATEELKSTEEVYKEALEELNS